MLNLDFKYSFVMRVNDLMWGLVGPLLCFFKVITYVVFEYLSSVSQKPSNTFIFKGVFRKKIKTATTQRCGDCSVWVGIIHAKTLHYKYFEPVVRSQAVVDTEGYIVLARHSSH